MSHGDPLEVIRKREAREFKGNKEVDLVVAEYWLTRVCRVIEELQCSPINSLW